MFMEIKIKTAACFEKKFANVYLFISHKDSLISSFYENK
jgi:hypothetical protein